MRVLGCGCARTRLLEMHLLCVILCSWFAATAAVAVTCRVGDGSAGGTVLLQESCEWPGSIALSAWTVRGALGPAATRGSEGSTGIVPTIFAPTGEFKSLQPKPAGAQVQLERVKLSGFTLQEAGSSGPTLWPQELLPATSQGASTLNMTDVWVLVNRSTLEEHMQFFANQPNIVTYSDKSTWIYIQEWSSGAVSAKSVTLLSGSCAPPAPPLNASGSALMTLKLPPLASSDAEAASCVLDATNRTLLPQLAEHAAQQLSTPFIAFITTNVTLGDIFQALREGIVVNRPLVLVGLRSQVTSLDFAMEVRQFNLMKSEVGSVSFLQLALENLAPGDVKSSETAGPYSVLITNNIWSMHYPKTSNAVCMWLRNCTCVVPQTELDYMVYMATMFNSELPYMQQQTTFLRNEIGLKSWVTQPGPGPHSVTCKYNDGTTRLWVDVIFTTEPVVAPRLPMPATATALVPNKPSPMVMSVRNSDELLASIEQYNREDMSARKFVVMVVAPLDLAPSADWPPPGGAPIKYQADVIGATPVSSMAFGYARDVLQLPPTADKRHLHFDQVQLLQLPQGPADAGSQRRLGRRLLGGEDFLPMHYWTLLLWSVARPMGSTASVTMSGTTMALPDPELSSLRRLAEKSGTFVVLLKGSQAISVQGALLKAGGEGLFMSSVSGPGLFAENVTYILDPAAAASPGYTWDAAAAGSDSGASAGKAPWVVPLAVNLPIGTLLLLAAGVLLLVFKRRQTHRRQSEATKGPCTLCKAVPCICPVSPGTATGGSSFTDSSSSYPGLGTGGSGGRRHGQGAAAALKYKVSSEEDCPDSSATRTAGAAYPGDQGEAALTTTIAAGMRSWRRAVSAATLDIMQRRMLGSAASPVRKDTSRDNKGSRTSGSKVLPQQLPEVAAASGPGEGGPTGLKGWATDREGAEKSVVGSQGSSTPPKLLELLGVGAFGAVYKGIWRGKKVAVKVMQLPANALLGSTAGSQPSRAAVAELAAGWVAKEKDPREAARACQQMAIMEAVISSTMCHPNVVQVFTYMLDPLAVAPTGSNAGAGSSSGKGVKLGQEHGIQLQGTALSEDECVVGPEQPTNIAGWELKLVMEYCNQGCLRDALDRGTLCGCKGRPLPSTVLSLAHDVASALMHLHAEGIVHGDIKAANVLLTSARSNSMTGGRSGLPLGLEPGQELTAKVADFGLALLLGPSDTHATHNSRGTPTHMSPELFMAGHVSKASDVYAFGILLWEMMTGQRAFAGVPTPLLPHEVARGGLRPQWPAGLLDMCHCYHQLQELAEACWQQQPSSRPSFESVLDLLAGLTEPSDGLQTAAAAVAAVAEPAGHEEPSSDAGRLGCVLGPSPGLAAGEAQGRPLAPPVEVGAEARGQLLNGQQPGERDAARMSWSQVTF